MCRRFVCLFHDFLHAIISRHWTGVCVVILFRSLNKVETWKWLKLKVHLIIEFNLFCTLTQVCGIWFSSCCDNVSVPTYRSIVWTLTIDYIFRTISVRHYLFGKVLEMCVRWEQATTKEIRQSLDMIGKFLWFHWMNYSIHRRQSSTHRVPIT